MQKSNLLKLKDFISHPHIEKVHKDVFKKLKDLPDIEAQLKESCSSNGTFTKIEKKFQNAVNKGILPIDEFTIESINNLYQELCEHQESSYQPKYILVKGIDSLELTNYAADNSIVQVASQFNGLESCTSDVTPVIYWIYDHTQGPRAALQSISGAKHREAAQMFGKLTDAILGVLDSCILSDGKKVLEKYPRLYSNGYLQFHQMASTTTEWLSLLSRFKNGETNPKLSQEERCLYEDIIKLANHLESDMKKAFFLSQWVKCQATGKIELQVFSAAPNFWSSGINWKENNALLNLLHKTAQIIISTQYEAIAQVAAIRSHLVKPEEPVQLHLTLVGLGVFHNPPDVMNEAFKKLKLALEKSRVEVHMHGWSQKDLVIFEQACDLNDITYEK